MSTYATGICTIYYLAGTILGRQVSRPGHGQHRTEAKPQQINNQEREAEFSKAVRAGASLAYGILVLWKLL